MTFQMPAAHRTVTNRARSPSHDALTISGVLPYIIGNPTLLGASDNDTGCPETPLPLAANGACPPPAGMGPCPPHQLHVTAMSQASSFTKKQPCVMSQVTGEVLCVTESLVTESTLYVHGPSRRNALCRAAQSKRRVVSVTGATSVFQAL